jgi:hypothetical protein
VKPQTKASKKAKPRAAHADSPITRALQRIFRAYESLERTLFAEAHHLDERDRVLLAKLHQSIAAAYLKRRSKIDP